MGGERTQPEVGQRTFTPFPEQNEDGVDLSLIRRNVQLSPLERLRRNYCHRLHVERLMEIGRQHRQNRRHTA